MPLRELSLQAYPTCKAELARNSYTPVTESSARGVHKRITPLAPLGYVKPAGGDLGVSAEMRASLNGGGLKAIASVSEVGLVLDSYRDASARPAISAGAGPLLEATSNYSHYAQSDSPSNCGQPLRTLPGLACQEDYGEASSPRSQGVATLAFAADRDPSGRSGVQGQRGSGLYTVSRGQPSEGQDPSMHGGSTGGGSRHGPISRAGTSSQSNFKRPDTSMTNLDVDVDDLSDEERA
jgi:hypothetical protein